MAKAIKKYDNKLSIRYIKKEKKYYITFGVYHIQINGNYSDGYISFEEAESVLLNLSHEKDSLYKWKTKNGNNAK